MTSSNAPLTNTSPGRTRPPQDSWHESIRELTRGTEMLAALTMASRLVNERRDGDMATVAETIEWYYGLTADETATVMARLDEELATAAAFDLEPADFVRIHPLFRAA